MYLYTVHVQNAHVYACVHVCSLRMNHLGGWEEFPWDQKKTFNLPSIATKASQLGGSACCLVNEVRLPEQDEGCMCFLPNSRLVVENEPTCTYMYCTFDHVHCTCRPKPHYQCR